MKKTDGTAAAVKSRDCAQTEDGESGEHFGTKAEKILRVGQAGDVEGELPIQHAVQDLCLTVVENEMQLMNRGARKKA